MRREKPNQETALEPSIFQISITGEPISKIGKHEGKT